MGCLDHGTHLDLLIIELLDDVSPGEVLPSSILTEHLGTMLYKLLDWLVGLVALVVLDHSHLKKCCLGRGQRALASLSSLGVQSEWVHLSIFLVANTLRALVTSRSCHDGRRIYLLV